VRRGAVEPEVRVEIGGTPASILLKKPRNSWERLSAWI
jgi:hypothetical protein